MAFSATSSSAKGWGDCDSDDEAQVPRRALAFGSKPDARPVAAAPSRTVPAEDLRQLADESQDGLNLAFKNALTMTGSDAAAPSMASALQAAMARKPRGGAASVSRSRKRTAAGRPVDEASPQKPASPLPAWSSRSPAGPSFAAALTGRGSAPESSSSASAAAAAPSTPQPASAAPDLASTPQTARASPSPLARVLSYASAASRETLPVQSLGKRMKRALLDDAGDTDEPRARATDHAATGSQAGAAEGDGSASAPTPEGAAGSEGSGSVTGSAARADRPAPEPLTEDRVDKRCRQIELGKATTGYRRYAAAVPRDARLAGSEFHPSTPDARAGETSAGSASRRHLRGPKRGGAKNVHRTAGGATARAGTA